jgi:hypothetical protein
MIKFIRTGILCLFISAFNVSAQTEYGESLKSRMFFGGDFRLTASTFASLIDIGPIAGYNLNPYLSVAAGPSYLFYSERIAPGNSFRLNFYGGRILTRLRPFPERLPGLFLQAEAQMISSVMLQFNPNTMEDERIRVWNPYYMAGIGFRQPAGENSFFTVALLVNFREDATAYSVLNGSPLTYKVGYIFGLF